MPLPDKTSTHGADERGSPGGVLPIDVGFDVELAERLARLESYNKHHYRPNSYLHKWWARRCGSTFRLILKHLVTEPELRDFYSAGGLQGKVIMDPMAGGGTTLHEAVRLGASVIGADIDPIPVLQARATLSPVALKTLEEAYATFYERLHQCIAPLFTTTCPQCERVVALRFLLYGARRRCRCGPVVLVDSYVLRYEEGKPAVSLCPSCHGILAGAETCTCGGDETAGSSRLLAKETSVCPRCGGDFVEDEARSWRARYQPLVTVGRCKEHGRFFAPVRAHDWRQLREAERLASAIPWDENESFAVGHGPKSRDLHGRGIADFRDLFSFRQLLYLHAAEQLLTATDARVRLNLALLVSTSLEFNSMLCGFKGARRGARPGAIRHTFSHHAYTFPYTALENNPVYEAKASGTLHKLFHDRIRRARRWAVKPRERNVIGKRPRFVAIEGELDGGTEVESADALAITGQSFFLHHGTASAMPLPDGCVDFIVTDPPYYDNVQYSDLATFFHVWLRRFGLEGIRWQYDGSKAVGAGDEGGTRYAAAMGAVLKECRRALQPEGRMIFTFHHWKPEGWAALASALHEAAFVLVNAYVVHAENPMSVHIANLRSLTHDAILVFAPRPVSHTPTWEHPGTVCKDDSYRFCYDCAQLLGWSLSHDVNPREYGRLWREALGG